MLSLHDTAVMTNARIVDRMNGFFVMVKRFRFKYYANILKKIFYCIPNIEKMNLSVCVKVKSLGVAKDFDVFVDFVNLFVQIVDEFLDVARAVA